MLHLSPHFTLNELMRSQVAVRHGIDNRPGPDETLNLKRLSVEVLEPVRSHFEQPFTPSSGYRCARLNRLIGGAENSQHIRGEAVDMTIPGVPNVDLALWIRDSLAFDQLILEYPATDDPGAGWVHCSFRTEDNRRQVLTRTRVGYSTGISVVT